MSNPRLSQWLRVLMSVAVLAVLLPVTATRLGADENDATEGLTQSCDVRPDATPDTITQSGVQGAVPGEWVTVVHTVEFAPGNVYQDILQRPDGSVFYSSRLELSALPTDLDADLSTIDFRIAPGGSSDPWASGVVQPWTAGTTPIPTGFVIETDTTSPDALFRLLFPGDEAQMLADQSGNGELSHVVPAGGEIFVLSYRAQVPTDAVWGEVHDTAECFAGVSTDPSNRDTDRLGAAVSVVEPVISIDKWTPLANVYNAGNDVEYEITVSVPTFDPTIPSLNVAPARDVIVVDNVPAGLVPLDATGSPAADGATTLAGGVWDEGSATVTYELGDLLPGTDLIIEEEMRIGPGLDPSFSLVNEATVGLSFLPGDSPADTVIDVFDDDSAEVQVASLPPTVSKDADIERTGSDLPFTYTVTVDIPASATYENFTVLDVLPDGLQFLNYVSATCLPAGPTCPAVPSLLPTVFVGGGTGIGWYPNSIPFDAGPRQIVLTYTVDIDPAYASGDPIEFFDEFENDLRVNWNTVDRLGAAVQPSTASPPSYDGSIDTSDVVIYDRPVLEIDKLVETSDGVEADDDRTQWDFAEGDIATYTSTITNIGSRDATDLVIVDTPAGLDIDPTTVTVGGAPCGSPGCIWDGTALTITLPGPIAPGGGVVIVYNAVPVANGNVDNAISIPTYGDGLGSTYTDNPMDVVPLEIPDPVLRIDKDPSSDVAATGVATTIGTRFPFTFTVTNISAVTAYSVQVTDVPPTGVCTITGGLDAGAVGVTESIPGVFTLDNPLAPGDSISFEAEVEVCGELDVGTYENVAELVWMDLTDNESETGNAYEDDDVAPLTLVGPSFEVTKSPAVDAGATLNWSFDADENGTVDYPAEINGGAWTFSIVNTSTVPIGGLEVDDLMPEPFEYLPGDASILWIGQAPDTFVDNSAPSGTATLPGHTEQLDFVVGQLLPEAEVRITVPFSHNGDDPPDGNLTRLNTVTVRNDNMDYDPALHTADGEYTLIPVEVGPSLSKTVEAVGVTPGVEEMPGASGTRFDFSIDVTVPTSSALSTYDLWVLDELPDGLMLINEPAAGAVPGAGGWTVTCVSGPCPATDGGTYLGSQTLIDGTTELAWFLGDTAPDPIEQESVYRLTFRVEVETTFDDGSEIIDGFREPLVNTAKPIFNRDDSVPGGSGNVVVGAPSAIPSPGDYDRVYAKDAAQIDVVTPRLDFAKTVYDSAGNPVTEVTAGESFSYEIIVTNVGSGPAFDIDITDDLGAPDLQPFMDVDQSSLTVTPAGTTCVFAPGTPIADHLLCEFAGPLAGDPDGPGGAGIGGQIVITYDATTVPNDDFYSQFSSQNFDPMIVLNRAAASEYWESPGGLGNSYSTGETISRLFAFTPVAEIDASCVGGAETLPNAPVGAPVQFWVLAGNGDRIDVNGNPDGDKTMTPFPVVDNDGDGFPDAGAGHNPEMRITIQDKFTFVGVQGTGPGAGDPTYTTYSPFPAPDQILDEVQPNTYTLVWNTSLQTIPHSPNHAIEQDFQPHYDLLIDVIKTQTGGATIWFDLTLEDAAGNTDRGTNVGEYWEYTERDRHGCPGGPPPRVWKGPDVEDAEKLAPGQASEFVITVQQPDDTPMAGSFTDLLPDGLMYAGDLPIGDPNYAEATMDVVPATWTDDNDGDGDVDLQDYFTSSVAQPNGDTIITWDPPPLPQGLWNDPNNGGTDTRWIIRVPVVALDDPPYPNEFVVNGFTWDTEPFGARSDSGAIITEGSGNPSLTKRVADDAAGYGDLFTYTIDVTIPAGFGGKDVIVYDEINRAYNWDVSPQTLQALGNQQMHATIFPVVPTTAAGPWHSGELHYANWLWTPAEMELDDYVSGNCVVGCSSPADLIDPVPMTPLALDNGASLPLTSSDGYVGADNGAAGWYLGDISPDPEGQDRVVRLVYTVEAPTLLEQRTRVAEQYPTGLPGGATDPLFDDPDSYWFQELSQVRHPNHAQIRTFGEDNANVGIWDGLGDTAWKNAPSTNWGEEVSKSAVLAEDDTAVTVAYPLVTMDKTCKAVGGTGDANPGVTPVGSPNIVCEIEVTNASPVEAFDVTVTDTPLTDCVMGARTYYGEVRYITNISNQNYWDPVADGNANGTGRIDPYDPDVIRYPCNLSGINVSHPALATPVNTLPAAWTLSIGPGATETLSYQLRVDGWNDLPANANLRDATNGSWEINGMWRNDAVLQPWADEPGGTPLGQEVRAHDEVMFHDTTIHVSKFPYPVDRDLRDDARPFINVFNDPVECERANLWPYRRLPCGYEYAANPNIGGGASYQPPQLFGDPYSGDYWMLNQPDAYLDMIQPPSRAITPFSWPWNLRGYALGVDWISSTGWRNYGDAYTANRGWWLRGDMDDPASWADVFDADPTQPYRWSINLRIDGMERLTDLDITDQLPFGWRYEPGSAVIVDGDWSLGYTGAANWAEDNGITPGYVRYALPDPVIDLGTEGACSVADFHEDGPSMTWSFNKNGSGDGAWPWDARYLDSRERYVAQVARPDRDVEKGASDKANWIRIEFDATPTASVWDCDPDPTSVEKYMMENNTRISARTDYDPATEIVDSYEMLVPIPTPVALEKTPDDDFVSDDTTSFYTVSFTNGLDEPLLDTVFTDVLSSSPVAPLAGGGYDCGTATVSGGTGFSETSCVGGLGSQTSTIEWTFASIAPGETITITIPVLIPKDERNLLVWDNTVSVVVDEWYDIPLVDGGKITVVNPSPPPTPTKAATPNPATINEVVEFEVSWTAAEAQVFMDLAYIDQLPDGLTFDSYAGVSCSGSCPASYTSADVQELSPVVNADGTTTLAWWFGDMPGANGAHTWTMAYRAIVDDTYGDGTSVSDGDQVLNSVTGYANEENLLDEPLSIPDPSIWTTYPPSLSGSETLDIVEPELEIAKQAVPSAVPTDGSSTITYTVEVSNNSAWPAYAVEVTDTPNGALENATLAIPTFPGSVITRGWTAIDPSIGWFVPVIQPGETAVFTYTAEVIDGYLALGFGTADNTAEIDGFRARPGLEPEDGDRSYEGDDVTTQTALSGPQLDMFKHAGDCASEFAFVERSESLTWCIEIVNNGGAPAYGAAVNDTLPYDWTYDAGSTAGSNWTPVEPTVGTLAPNVQTVDWLVGDIAAGATVFVEFNATPGDDSPLNVTNWATAESFGLDGSPIPTSVAGARSDDPATAAMGQYALEISKTPDRQEFGILPGGNTVSWTITITNPSNLTTNTALEATDFLPAPMTFQTWSSADPRVALVATGAPGAGPGATQQIDWTISDLAAGEAIDIVITADTPASVALETWHVNDVQVVSAEVVDEVVNQAKVRYVDPELDVEKTTNGLQADIANGPGIVVGDTVTWTYTIENTGPVAFVPAIVTDSEGETVTCAEHHGDTNGDHIVDVLLPGETVICKATGPATSGQYSNLATLTGTPAVPDPSVCRCDPNDPATWPPTPKAFIPLPDSNGAPIADLVDTDPSHFFGADPDIAVEKSTNTVDADNGPGPAIAPGDPVTWTYVVANTGNTALAAVGLTDSQGVTITCESHRDDNNLDAVLDIMSPGDKVTCTGTGTAQAGAYENVVQTSGTPMVPGPDCGCDLTDPTTWPDDPKAYGPIIDAEGAPFGDVGDDDPSHYFGSEPGVEIEKSTNSVDADAIPGPGIAPGGAVVWTYVVENTGNTALADVAVTDDQGVVVDCGGGSNVIAILLPGDTVTCTGTGTAAAGAYANTGSVSGDPVAPNPETCGCDPTDPTTWPEDPEAFEPLLDAETGEPIAAPTDDDPSHYFGSAPSIDVEKSTNAQDADNGPGPAIAPGDAVTWTYVVENTGNTALADVELVDSRGVAISCAVHDFDADLNAVVDLMLPGDRVTCTGQGTAQAGAYDNVVDTSGSPVVPGADCECDLDDPSTWPEDPSMYAPVRDDAGNLVDEVIADDPSHYFGSSPGVDVEKSTNGLDADNGPGPGVATGGAIGWVYEVKNTGNTALVNVTVVDDQGVTVDCGGGSNVIPLLLPGASVTCTGTGLATPGAYRNTASVTGDPVAPNPESCGCDPTDPTTWPEDPDVFERLVDPETGDPVGSPTDEDPSHFFGSEPGIDIEKSTNTVDADNGPGPAIAPGGAVTWTYVVENTGNTALAGVTVVDDQGVVVDCGGGSNVIAIVLPGEKATCTGSGVAVGGAYENNASVSGDPVAPNPETCGCDPTDPTTWPEDPDAFEVLVDPETGAPLDQPTAGDPSHYFGSAPGLAVEKSTNGQDADNGPGPGVVPGSQITWSYDVENTGNTALVNITVVDDQGVTVDCGDGTNVIALLLPGASVTCTGTGVAVAGAYQNAASVSGDPVAPDPETCGCDPTDPTTWPEDPEVFEPLVDPETGEPIDPPTGDDPSHYFGAAAGLAIEKSTNGVDADTGPGPAITPEGEVTWTYDVENTGNTALVNVTVVDDQGVTVDCGVGSNVIPLLLPGATVTCTGSGTAEAGAYENNALVTGDPVAPDPETCGCDPTDPTTWPEDPDVFESLVDPETGDPVVAPTAEDPSHYFGSAPGLDVEKSTNGLDADNGPGPGVATGGAIGWVYVVRNTGNTALAGVAVVDDQGVTVDCGGGSNVIPLLLPGASVTCTGTGLATPGAYRNTASVTGEPVAPNPETCDCDPTDPTTWPEDPTVFEPLVDPETGDPATPPTDDDPSHFFGSEPGVAVQKSTDGQDADTGPGPGIDPGAVVTWSYVVENTGNTALANVAVVDDQGVVVDCGDGTNVISLLLPGASLTCTGTGTAVPGAYTNNVAVSGEPVAPDPETCGCDPTDPTTWPQDPNVFEPLVDPETGDPVVPPTADDPSHYFGADPALDIEKSTNGEDADNGPGPGLSPGDLVTWTYDVTNTGNTALAGVAVVDDQGVSVDCGGGSNVIPLLVPGASVTCTGTGIAEAGAYVNNASVTGEPVAPNPETCTCDPTDPTTWPEDPEVFDPLLDPETGEPISLPTDDDPSHYFGDGSALDIEKSTNGFDADVEPGPGIAVGELVTWTYAVENTGNAALVNVTVTDDQNVTVDCGDGSNVVAILLPGDLALCTGSGVAVDGPYTNNGSVTGDPVAPNPETCGCDPTDPSTWPAAPELFDPLVDPETGEPVLPPTSEDPSHYFGSEGGIELEKSTNLVDADTAPGPGIAPGDRVTWSYVVTNTSDVALADIELTDDQGVAIDCGDGTATLALLLPGENHTCTGSAPATPGGYRNNSSVIANPVLPDPSTCGCDLADSSSWPDDPSQYEPFVDPETGQPAESLGTSDPSHYFGAITGLDLEKSTLGVDADEGVGPAVPVGGIVTWTYSVSNTGNTALAPVTVADDQGVVVDCGDGSSVISLLLPGQTVVCTGSAAAIDGRYVNNGSVSGGPVLPDPDTCDCDLDDPLTWPSDPELFDPVRDPKTGEPLTPPVDEDLSHYLGVGSELSLEKSTNGVDADTPETAVAIGEGAPVSWTYTVVNNGATAFTALTVGDDRDVFVDCGDGTPMIDLLLPSQAVTCTGSGDAALGSYVNIGSVVGQPAMPDIESCECDLDDPSTWPLDPGLFVPVRDPETGEPMGPVEDDDPSHYEGEAILQGPLPFTGSGRAIGLTRLGLLLAVVGAVMVLVTRNRNNRTEVPS